VQKDAILFTLRELTQRDGARDYAGWADLLKRMAVEEKKWRVLRDPSFPSHRITAI
jgi:hypothetical protein